MCRWEGNVKMNHKKKVVEDVDWMDLRIWTNGRPL